MESKSKQSSGVVASIQRLSETLLSALRNRIELFGLELQEEKEQFIATLLAAAAVIFLSVVSVVTLTITVVAFTPEQAQPFVLLGFSVLYLILTVAAGLALRKKLKGRPPPFADSVAELKKDLDCFRTPQ